MVQEQNNPRDTITSPLVIAGATLGLGFLGWLIIDFVQKRSLIALLYGKRNIMFQLITGAGYGLVSGFLAWQFVSLPFMSVVNARYLPIFARYRQPLSIGLLSLCAGVGEEILFRGAIQHWLGIVMTTVVFIGIHGYIKIGDWRLSAYGLLMCVTTIPLGLMADHWGLVSAIVAHACSNAMLYLGASRMLDVQ